MAKNDAVEVVDVRSGEVATVSRASLEEVLTYDQVIALSGLTEAELTFLGSVYRVIDKEEAINRAFVVRDVKFKFGDRGPYCVIYAVMRDTDEMVILTDGSTGIYAQLEALSPDDEMEITRPFVVPNGLRKSVYELGEDGHAAKKGEGTGRFGATYYLA